MPRRPIPFLCLLVLGMAAHASTPAPARAGESHPFSVHDMLAMDRISDAQGKTEVANGILAEAGTAPD